MTNPKPGDRVRGTIEGRIEVYRGRQYVSVRGGEDAVWLDHVQEIEVLPEPIVLPTARWSMVIIDPTGKHFEAYRLGGSGSLWCSTDRCVTADVLRCDAEKYGYRIVEVEND